MVSSGDNHRLHPGIVDRARHARTRFVIEPVKSPLDEAGAPFADRLRRHAKFRSDHLVGLARRTRKNDAGAQGQGLRRLPTARQAPQPLFLGRTDFQRRQRPTDHDLFSLASD